MSIKTVEIHDIEGIKDLAFEQTRNQSNGRMRSSYFYRGLPDTSYKLLTSLQRNCKDKGKPLEKPLLENFIKYVRVEDPNINESVWRAMIIGQHYGLPTRLMDWTHSTLIALHFANTEDDLDNLSKRDCLIWRIDARELNKNLPDNYRQLLEEKKTFIFSLETLTSIQGMDNKMESLDRYDQEMGSNSFVFLEPPSIDQRIANQYSFFSVMPNGISDLEDFLDKHSENTVRYIIDKNLRWDIRDYLDQFNISERMIYPGKAGIAKWLARHYYVKE